MSCQETTYVVLGVKMPFDYFNEEEREAIREKGYVDGAFTRPAAEVNGLTVILDGMNADYMVVGKVLDKAIHENGEGMEFTVLDITDSAREEVARLLADNFSIVAADVQPMVFTHYS